MSRNLPLFIFDMVVFPVTLVRLLLIYCKGARYGVKKMEFLDVMMHAENKYFNQEEDSATIDTMNTNIQETVKEASEMTDQEIKEVPEIPEFKEEIKEEVKQEMKAEPEIKEADIQINALIDEGLKQIEETYNEVFDNKPETKEPVEIDESIDTVTESNDKKEDQMDLEKTLLSVVKIMEEELKHKKTE